jgi:hypothetical protein
VRVLQQTVDRATQMSACHAGGRGFESRRSRHLKSRFLRIDSCAQFRLVLLRMMSVARIDGGGRRSSSLDCFTGA